MSFRIRGARPFRRVAALLALVILAPACARDVGSLLGPNQPPELEIVGGRGTGAGVRVRWEARDPEGRLAPTHWRLEPWALRGGDTGEEHTTTLEECTVPADRLASARATGATVEPQRFTLWAVDADVSQRLTLLPGGVSLDGMRRALQRP